MFPFRHHSYAYADEYELSSSRCTMLESSTTTSYSSRTSTKASTPSRLTWSQNSRRVLRSLAHHSLSRKSDLVDVASSVEFNTPSPRHAIHVPSTTPCHETPPEVQDDSFVTFSIGHLHHHRSQQFSVLNVAKVARILVRDDTLSDDSRGASSPRRRRRRRQKRVRREKRAARDSLQSDRLNPLLAPVRRCFYY